ncbi:MAG: pyridine nucleotide-disulfide oxidoreductase, partial [Blastocatellia bacterium]
MTLDVLGIPGFSYADLYEPSRLAELTAVFHADVATADPELAALWRRYAAGELTAPTEVSDAILRMAPRLAAFLERMFDIAGEAESIRARNRELAVLFEFKKQFVRRRVHKQFATESPALSAAEASARVESILAELLPDRPADDEVAVATVTM